MTYHVEFPGFGISFDISPAAFTIGTFSVYWYGIIVATGCILAITYCMNECKRCEIDEDKALNCIMGGLVCAIVGARLYYVVFRFDSFKGDLLSILNIHNGGLAIYGGLIGAVTGGMLIAKKQNMKLLSVMDIAVRGFLIGQGIGRWGNFVNQEAFGTQTDLPWRMVSENTGGVGVHPCFLYESLWCLLGFVLLHILSRKTKCFEGEMFYLYMVWYGFERMLVEGLRTDSLYLPFANIRVSQLISGVLFLTGITLLLIFSRKKKTE